MNFYIILTLVAVLALGATASPISTKNTMDFGEALTKFFRKLKQQNFCGFPGQKPSFPMTIPSATLSKNTPELSYDLNVENVYIIGSNNYEVVAFNYDNVTKEMYLHMNSSRSQVLGTYSLNSTVMVAGLPINIYGNGFVDMEAVDARMIIKFKFVNDANTGKLAMANLSFSEMAVGQVNAHNTGLMGDVNFDNFANKLFQDTNNPFFYQLMENTVLKNLYPNLMDTYNQWLGLFNTVDELTSALIAAIGPDDKGLFGQPLCMIRY